MFLLLTDSMVLIVLYLPQWFQFKRFSKGSREILILIAMIFWLPILFSRSNIMKCSSPKVNVITSLPTLQPDYAFAV